jgi:hypothetical protein
MSRSQTARLDRLLKSSLADLHERLGEFADMGPSHRPVAAQSSLRDLTIEDYVRKPNMPRCTNAKLRREEERLWKATDEAWERFKVHGSKARYRADLAAINEGSSDGEP